MKQVYLINSALWHVATLPKTLKFVDKSKFEPGKLVCYDRIWHSNEFANQQQFVDYLDRFFEHKRVAGWTDGLFVVYEILKVKQE